MIRALIVAVAGSGCLLPQVVPEALGKYQPSGELQFEATASSFDSSRVRSPQMNLSRRTDGSWTGTFQDRPFDVSVTPTHARGVDLVLALESSGEGGLRIAGIWRGRTVRYVVAPDHFSVRARSHTLDLQPIAPGTYGPKGELDLRGEAATTSPPWPQIGFALLALFN